MRIQNFNQQKTYTPKQKTAFKCNIWSQLIVSEGKMIKPNVEVVLPSIWADKIIGQGLIDKKDDIIKFGTVIINKQRGLYFLDKTTRLYKQLFSMIKDPDDEMIAKRIIEDAQIEDAPIESLELSLKLPKEYLIDRPFNVLPFRPKTTPRELY